VRIIFIAMNKIPTTIA